MNDLGHQLRNEARLIRPQVPPGLAPRIRAAVAAAPASDPAPHRLVWLPVAAAAAVLVASALAWLARPVEAPQTQPAIVAVPSPPGISDLMRAAEAAREQTPRHDEIDALGADLAAAVRTVRGAIPF